MLGNFTEVKPLQYWIQHILPLVYDDSLSYMELLGKVVNTLNEVVKNNNLLPDYIMKLIKEYISSGEIEKVLADVLANYMLNVKFPPAGLKPATGNGSADDTEAIQGCIDYAYNNGGMSVYFPSGSYLTQPLSLRDKATLFGQDRYTTRLVMKGGATTAMFTGNVDELTLTGLGFDANMDIQVNNVNLFTISVNSAIITNCLLTDGYDLLNITVNGDLQLNDVIFRHAVENALVLKGGGIVQGNNLIFKSVSALVGKNFVVMDVSKSILEQLKCYGASPNAVLINGNNNVVKMWNEQSLKAYTDNGVNNTVEVYTQSEQKKLTGSKTTNISGDITETVGGNKTETITGEKEVNANGSTENIANAKHIIAGSVTEDITYDKHINSTNIVETVTNTKTIGTNDLIVKVKQNSTETVTGNKGVSVHGSVKETIDGTLTESNTGHTETITGNDTKTVTGDVSETSQNKEVTAKASYIERGVNKTETFTGAKNETLGSSRETITGDKVVTAANSTETLQGDKTLNTGDYAETVTGNKTVKVTGDYTEDTDGNKNESIGIKGTVTAPEYYLNIANHLTYETPLKFNERFQSVKMKDSNNIIYNVAVLNMDSPNILTVGKDGDYETITAAVNKAKTYANTNNRVLIIINSGSYDESVTLNPNPGIDFIGLGFVNWNGTGSYPEAALYTIGKCYVENIIFKAQPTSYSVHIEAGGLDSYIKGQMIFRNCYFDGIFGAGLGDGINLLFENCTFAYSTLYVHNKPNPIVQEAMTLKVIGCTFLGNENSTAVTIEDAATIANVSVRSYMFCSFINNTIFNATKTALIFRDGTHTGENYLEYIPGSPNIALDSSYGNNYSGLNNSVLTFDVQGINAYVSTSAAYAIIKIPYDLKDYTLNINSMVLNGVGNLTNGPTNIKGNGFTIPNEYGRSENYVTGNITLTPKWKAR